MKRFLKQIIVLFSIVILIFSLVKSIIPYYWWSNQFSDKVIYLEKHNNYNTFFIGSSRVYYHINPLVFDSIVNNNFLDKIRSFNLGSDGMYLPENYYLLENLIKSEQLLNAKYIFVELQNEPNRFRINRDEYWQNTRDLVFLSKIILEKDKGSIISQYFFIANIVKSYIISFFDLDQFKSYILKQHSFNSNLLGKYQNGYLALNGKLEMIMNIKGNIEGNRNIFLKDSLYLKKLNKEREIKLLIETSEKVSVTHLKRIQYLIDLAKNQNIQLIFFTSPMLTNPSLINLYKKLPKENRIALNQSPDFSNLLKKDNLYDIHHFNDKGARLYTEIFANEFTKFIKINIGLNNEKKKID